MKSKFSMIQIVFLELIANSKLYPRVPFEIFL